MKTKFSFSIFLCLVITNVSAQHFMHDFGGSVAFAYGKFFIPDVNEPNQTGKSGYYSEQLYLNYFPRYNFVETKKSSVSIGIMPGAGIGIAADFKADSEDRIYFTYALPVYLDYNVGLNSNKKSKASFGGYFGVGYEYAYLGHTIGAENPAISSYGPVVHAGVTFYGYNDHIKSISLYFKPGMEDQHLKTIGIQVLTDF